MKKIILYSILSVCLSLLTFSCDDYLSHDLGELLTLEEVFRKKATTEEYLNHVYSFLKQEYLAYAASSANMTSLSDEAYFSWLSYVDYPNHNSGSWSPATEAFHTWTHYYQGIDQASIFVENVDSCTELTEAQRGLYKSEARFLRAYYYFKLIEQYGPVVVWGDKRADRSIPGTEIDRQPLDSCINFVLSELYKAATGLQNQKVVADSKWTGRVTYGTALALKSRLTLYAARPLYNGCPWYVGMKNYYGQFLFPQTAKPEKWEAAAKAAKAIIDLGDNEGYYSLCTATADDLTKGINNYGKIFLSTWNKEIIFARWESSGYAWGVRAAPAVVLSEGYAGYAPSLKLVDTYPVSTSGRFPMQSGEGTMEPVIDIQSGYEVEGFTDDWANPIDPAQKKFKVHNSCKNRDSRYYASILFNGMYWINDANGQRIVTFYKNGTSPYGHQSGDFSKVGFLFRRMSNPGNNTEAGSWGNYSWPYLRFGEMYLNYAEAWVMMDASVRSQYPSGLVYWNKIRTRAGLNNIENAYPEIFGGGNIDANRDKIIDLLLKERMVEMAFENVRYFDVRTWMRGMKESNGPRYGLNLNAATYEDSWKRTGNICRPIVCERKHHLFPIYQGQLNEMKNMTQNYGW